MPKGVTRRGDSWRWSVMVDGVRRTGTALTEAAAKEARKLAAAQLRVNGAPEEKPKAWTLGQAVTRTWSIPQPRGWLDVGHPESVEKNVRALFRKWPENTLIDTIDADALDLWVSEQLEDGYAHSTINQRLGTLAKPMKTATRFKGLTSVPEFPPRLTVKDSGRFSELNTEEEAFVLKWLGRLPDQGAVDAITIMIDMGLRNSEVWALEPRDYRAADCVLMVNGVDGDGTKNGLVRSVPVPERSADVLGRRLADAKRGQAGKLFPDMNNSKLRTAWDKPRAELGKMDDRDFVPYICRHTCASRKIRAGVSVPVVKDWMGHKSIAVTMKYVKVNPSDLKAVRNFSTALAA